MKRNRLLAAFLLAAVFAGSLVASRVDAQDAKGVKPLEAIGLYTFSNPRTNETSPQDEPKQNPVVTALDVYATPQGKTLFYAGGDSQRFYVRNVEDVEGIGDKGFVSVVEKADANGANKTVFKKPYSSAGDEGAPINDWIRAISVNPATKEVATLSQRGRVAIWSPQDWEQFDKWSDPETIQWKQVVHWDAPAGVNNGARAMKFSPNGKILAVCGFDPLVRFYCYEGKESSFSCSDFKPIQGWPALSQSCTTLDFYSDRDPDTGRCLSTLLAVGGRNGAWIWNVATGDLLKKIELSDRKLSDKNKNNSRRVRAVAFSPDGTRLAVAGDADRIMIWNLASDKDEFSEISLLDERGTASRKIFSMTFTDDNTLATGDSVNDVILWNVSTGEMKAIGKGLDVYESKGKEGDSSNGAIRTPAHSGTVATLVYVENEKDPVAPRSLLSGGFDALVIRWALP